MKRLISFLLSILVLNFNAISAFAIVDGAEYRALLMSFPKNLLWNSRPFRDSPQLNLRYEISSPVSGAPSVLRIPVYDGTAIEFYDQFNLSETSFIELENRRMPIYCLWVHGQDNRQLSEMPGTPELLFTKIIWVAESSSCHLGPVRPSGGATWQNFFEVRSINPFSLSFGSANLYFRGNNITFSDVLAQQ